MSWSLTGEMPYVGRCLVQMNAESMKQSDDPESTRDFRLVSGSLSEVKESVSESGFERADVLSIRAFARGSLMQSSGDVGSQGLLNLFLGLSQVRTWTGPDHSWPWMWLRWALENP